MPSAISCGRGAPRLGWESLAAIFYIDVCLGVGPFQADFQVLTTYIQNWAPPRTSTSFEARTQLAWHKKLPFNGEHLKLMGQVRVFELGWVTLMYESHGNVQSVKLTARLRGIRIIRKTRNNFCKDFQAVSLHFASIKFPLHFYAPCLILNLPRPDFWQNQTRCSMGIIMGAQIFTQRIATALRLLACHRVLGWSRWRWDLQGKSELHRGWPRPICFLHMRKRRKRDLWGEERNSLWWVETCSC